MQYVLCSTGRRRRKARKKIFGAFDCKSLKEAVKEKWLDVNDDDEVMTERRHEVPRPF